MTITKTIISIIAASILVGCAGNSANSKGISELTDASGDIYGALLLGNEVSMIYNPSNTDNAALQGVAAKICGEVGKSIGARRDAVLAHPEKFPAGAKKAFIACV